MAFLDYELWALPGLLLPASPALWSASGQIPQALQAGSSGLCAWARGDSWVLGTVKLTSPGD